VEKVWFAGQNKQLQDKRRQEELAQTMKEWSEAKQRLEAEIQRKKEYDAEESDEDEIREDEDYEGYEQER